MQIPKLDFFSGYIELVNIALRSSTDFPDKMCDFLVKEFELATVVLFKINGNHNFELVGKSKTTRKTLVQQSHVACPNCKNVNENNQSFRFSLQSNCHFNITDFFLVEGCVQIPVSDSQIFLLKIAKKNGFSQAEVKGVESLAQQLKNVLKLWVGNKTMLNNSLSSIIADYSQELRSSTNSIMGYTALLSEENLSQSQYDLVSTLKENSFSLLSIINDLVELSKLDSGNAEINFTSVDFNSYISEIINFFAANIEKSQLEFVLDIESSIPKEIKVDIIRLKYIFQTILTNSARLTEKGKISVSISAQSKNKLVFRISDTSPGLTAKVASEFFKPFAVTDLYLNKIGNLTGLSLTLTQKYIEFLRGEISISTGIGKGITYNFTVAAEMAGKIEDQLSSLPKALPKKNKVLVVEDDYASSKLLKNYLTKWGYDPVIVNSANQAFKIIETEQFISVILDIKLPDGNGFDVLHQLRENESTKHIPVIVCTVQADQQRAFVMGSVEYFVKPVDYNFLMEVLTNYKLKRESTILIVDDDVPTLNLVKEFVEKLGFKTIAENASNKVMSLIENANLDLAIIDLEMPVVNGLDLIKMIKSNKRFSKLPIIIYTGKENYSEDLKKIDGLFSELLLKSSSNIEDLANSVKSMISGLDEPVVPVDEKKKTDSVKILLVEDYKHSQIIVTRLLRKNNYESIVVAENGLQAYEEVQRQHFDLILMDMQMSVMNGFEATQKIRKLNNYKKTPIIALTAFAMKGDREKCIEAGATDYIPKPLDSQEFIEKVNFYTKDKRGL